MKPTEKQHDYMAPEIELIGVSVEHGFASSFEPSIEDGNVEDAWS